MNKTEMISRDAVKYVQQEIPMDRVFALVDLVNECLDNDVQIKKVIHFQNGFSVVFEGMDGDAVLHDNSYGNRFCEWETIGMPWDGDDVSVHDTETLVKMLTNVKTIPEKERYVFMHHTGMNGYYYEYFADKDEAVKRAKSYAKNAEKYTKITVTDRWLCETVWEKPDEECE